LQRLPPAEQLGSELALTLLTWRYRSRVSITVSARRARVSSYARRPSLPVAPARGGEVATTRASGTAIMFAPGVLIPDRGQRLRGVPDAAIEAVAGLL
jgi:hypothetical protein